MARYVIEHDCDQCALHRQYIEGFEVEQDDVKAFERINVISTNAIQAAAPDSIQSLPEGTSDRNKEIFVLSAMKEEDDAQLLIRDWWLLMKEKYPIPNTSKFDNNLAKFYECVDDNGNVSVDGNFVPKLSEGEKYDLTTAPSASTISVALNDHVCSACALKRRYIEDIAVAKEDIASFERINVIYTNAENRVASIADLPESLSAENALIWSNAARARQRKASELIREWWLQMKEKYPIPDSVKFDNLEGKFYECVDENGVASIDGNFVPKA